MPDVFSYNRRSSFLDSGKTLEQLRTEPEKKYVNSNGAAAIVGTIGDEMFKSMAYLTEWLLPDTRVGAMPTVDAQGPVHPARTEDEGAAAQGLLSNIAPSADEMHQAPFNLAFGTNQHLFEWLELPENSARLARFGHAMLSTREMETTDEILRGYSWADLPPGSVLVDVGGGIGSSSMDVVQAYPHISVVVEDRPQVVETAVLFWGPQYAPLFESGRLSWRVRDIFAPWTPLPDARVPDVFLLRLVLHDWPDAEAQLILTHLRSGAGPNTKLVIGETLLTYACKTEDGASLAQDGSQLLPNLGAGNMHGYLVDISLMGLVSGKERTEREMSELVLAAGWKIVEVRRSPGSLWAYVTAVPVD
ncbi:S-adenosyl-L-methionine-dependent methyltransferase [Trametes elegans]|nr:S-adenosyl-L-methionine-dependent methyltransferase [Trametes elegans]